ncbi:hypothetical protein [Agrobacterium radiobacter]|uniref:hypothetical protein n=1 Tax=Agrobacterium radiobacter TaxID=362 RepID=UPI000DD45D26
MAFAIGLRFYKITIRKKGDIDPLEIGPDGEPCDFIDFVETFVKSREEPTDEEDSQRTWFFEPVKTESIRTIHGLISYGTHGFEAKIKDRKTKKKKYDRLPDDLEEVPLYFQYWVPSGARCAFAGFQSFQGRSCVSFVQRSMTDAFKAKFPGYSLRFNILAPGEMMDANAPVKSITFTRPNTASDSADKKWDAKSFDEAEYELTVRAKRRGGVLATLKELAVKLPPNKDGFVEFEGESYESVRADVKIGNKRRVVGLFGSGGDAGLIDVTEIIKTDRSGHPTFESLANEVDDWMSKFYAGIKT